MCLSTISETYRPPIRKIHAVEKEFIMHWDNRATATFRYQHATVPLDQWITAIPTKVLMPGFGSGRRFYMSGYHAYAVRRKRRPDYSFIDVYVRDITIRGMDGGRKTIVANQMYVPSSQAEFEKMYQRLGLDKHSCGFCAKPKKRRVLPQPRRRRRNQ